MDTLISIIKNSDGPYLLLLFLIGVSSPFTANSNNFFNLFPIQIPNKVNLGEPFLAWNYTIYNLNTFPDNIQSGCLSAYTTADQYGCVESAPFAVAYNETVGYDVKLQTHSQVVAGVTYALGLSGNIVAGIRNLTNGDQGHNTKQPIHPNFSNPNILNVGFTFGPYQANYCDAKSGCTVNAIAFLTGESKLDLHLILPSNILDVSHYEFHNLSLGNLQVRTGRWNNGSFQSTLTRYIEFLFSGSIEVDKRCFVSVDQLTLSFPTIKSNMDNGVVGKTKLSTTSTCNNLGLRTSVSIQLVPVGSSIIEGNAMTLATSENGSRALGILFHPEYFPTQCEGGDSQPFYNYLLSGNHEPGIGSSVIQHDIYFSLCKYGIPTPGKHTAALDMFIQWDNLSDAS